MEKPPSTFTIVFILGRTWMLFLAQSCFVSVNRAAVVLQTAAMLVSKWFLKIHQRGWGGGDLTGIELKAVRVSA